MASLMRKFVCSFVSGATSSTWEATSHLRPVILRVSALLLLSGYALPVHACIVPGVITSLPVIAGILEQQSSPDYGKEISSYVMFSGNSVTLRASSDEKRQADILRNKVQGDFIWFMRANKAYYVDNPAIVERAKSLFRPQMDVTEQKAKVTEQKTRVTDEKSKVSQEKSDITGKAGNEISALREQIDALRMQISQSKRQDSQADVNALQSKINGLQARINEVQKNLNEQQGRLGEQQARLNEKQEELGLEQGSLGEQQARLAEKAFQSLSAVLEDAWRDHLAKPAE